MDADVTIEEPGAGTFAGMPIIGEPRIPYNAPVAQRPVEELMESLQTVLMHPNIMGVGWTQYTPYFNDGDPCVFSVQSAYVNVDGVDSFTKAADDYFSPDGNWRSEWDFDREIVWGPVVPGGIGLARERTVTFEDAQQQSVYEAFQQFERLLNSGSYDVDLQKYFGDHCKVIAEAEGGITIEDYEHD